METNIWNRQTKKSITRTMTDRQIGLCNEVADGCKYAYPLIHNFYKYKKFDVIIQWLFDNNVKGMKLVDWVRIEHNNSPLFAVIYILKRVERDIHRDRISASLDLRVPVFQRKK